MATTQQIKTVAYKNLLLAYGSQINVQASGTYWDTTSNAIGATAAEVQEYIDEVNKGNNPPTANSFMLESWATGLAIGARKPGYFASGMVNAIAAPSYPFDVNAGLQMFVGSNYYVVTEGVSVANASTNIPVQSIGVGAEYNLISGVHLSSTLAGVDFLSLGIGGGSGRETDAELLNRIIINIQFRKTDSMLSDYNQLALQFYNYASANTIFDTSNTVPIGVSIIACNTINDYALASKNTVINHVELEPSQIASLQSYFFNQRSTNSIVQVGSIPTQVIGAGILDLQYTTKDNVNPTGDQSDQIIELSRQSLLEFQGNVLAPHNLDPDFSSMGGFITSAYFAAFAPIAKTSILMDSLNITATKILPT